MNNGQIVIASPSHYEQLIAEIVINGQTVAMITRDKGDDNLEIEFLVTHEDKQGIPLSLFLELIEDAKLKLLSYDRV